MPDTDIALIWNPAQFGYADFQISSTNPQLLETNQDLVTSITISLMTDRLAAKTDRLPIPNSTNRRGWWGDTYLQTDPLGGDIIGSRLWLLSRSSSTDETLITAKGYVFEALNWLITRRIATSLNVNTFWIRPNNPPKQLLGISIDVIRRGFPTIDLSYAWAWQQITNPIVHSAVAIQPVGQAPNIPSPGESFSDAGYGDGPYGENLRDYSDGSYQYGDGNYGAP